jgi:hypothetical protein
VANIANILPILAIFRNEIKKTFWMWYFLGLYIQKTYFYVIAYLRCPQTPLFFFPSWHFCKIWKDIQLKLTCLSYKQSKSFSTSLILPSSLWHCHQTSQLSPIRRESHAIRFTLTFSRHV